MRSRAALDDSVADVTRRRLDALFAELAAARGELPQPSVDAISEAPGEESAAPDRATGGRHARRALTPGARLAGWVHDRLPAAVQGRAHLGAAQFGLVAVVVAAGLVIGAWSLVQAGDAGEVVPPRAVAPSPALTPSAAPASPGTGTPTAVPGTTEGQIVVDVVGKVRDPGIAVLPVGARVVDAVRAAGGMRPGVDPATVNLARPLTDGEQVVIGVAGTAGLGTLAPAGTLPPAGAPGAALVNLNTADQVTLETLPGVGPVTAAAIIEWRTEHGGFTAVDELLEVSGIGDSTLAEIAPHVTV